MGDTIAIKMLFALLRSSLHNVQPESSVFEGVSEQDWKRCFKIASKQGVLALVWEGVLMLAPELHLPLIRQMRRQ